MRSQLFAFGCRLCAAEVIVAGGRRRRCGSPPSPNLATMMACPAPILTLDGSPGRRAGAHGPCPWSGAAPRPGDRPATGRSRGAGRPDRAGPGGPGQAPRRRRAGRTTCHRSRVVGHRRPCRRPGYGAAPASSGRGARSYARQALARLKRLGLIADSAVSARLEPAWRRVRASPDRHQPACGGAGSCTVTRSPPAALGATARVPSCAWVILFTIARPRPTPAWSVRTRSVPRRNGSTSVATNWGVSFSPVFSTMSTTHSA